MNEKLKQSRINQYANKFFADNSRNTPVTDATLEHTFKNCVIPAKPVMYAEIKERIKEMKADTTYKFNNEE
ncbi:hypothetical protein [Paenibacillus medicaginis]|uniref:Uncharacterized protein n=1 Tax=Paenibacillus medicaginis TaxID=1470560 RepID=A0ABV5BUU0_9BACL